MAKTLRQAKGRLVRYARECEFIYGRDSRTLKLFPTSYYLLYNRICREQFGEHDLLAFVAGRVDGVGGHARLAHALEERVDFGRFAGPVGFDSGNIQAVHRTLEIFAVEDGGFVCLAGEAPVCGGVDEHRAARFGEVFDEFRRVAVPAVFGDELCRSCVEDGIDFGFVLGRGECEPECGEQNDGANDGCDFTDKCDSRRGYFPDGETEDDAQERDNCENGDSVVSRLFMHDPQKPSDRPEQKNAHDFLERHHPGSGFREYFQDAWECAHEHVGECKPDSCCGKEQKENRCRCGKRESHSGAEKRCGTRRAQKYEERPCEKSPRKSLLAPGGVHLGRCTSGEPNFKNSEKAHGKRAQDDDHERDESGTLELHAPACVSAPGFDGGDDGGQEPKACENADCRCRTQHEQAFAAFARLLDETEQLQRKHRQHAWHEVQN